MPIINQIVKGGGSPVTGPRLEWTVDSYGYMRSTTSEKIDFTGVKYLEVGMGKAYYQNQNISGMVSFGDIEEIKGSSQTCMDMYSSCPNITIADMSSVKIIASGGATELCYGTYRSSTGLVKVDLSSLTLVNGSRTFNQFCRYCTSLVEVDIRSLETIGSYATYCFTEAFNHCDAMTKFEFPSLSSMAVSGVFSYTFAGCANLASLWFYALNSNSFGAVTNQFNDMLYNCSGVTVHFPIAIQSTIGSWSSVTSGFGGTNTIVLFDIVTTLTGADTNAYTRSQKNSTSTAIAWIYNDTLYYTSGTSEPSVSDTIYSNAACTTSVTTIDSIA